VLPTCDELGVGFVPWSPLGQGFLTATVDPTAAFDNRDVRSRFPRFSPEARKANQPIVDLVKDIAGRLGATPAQVALAWLLTRRPWIVPIPGTRKLHRLEENLAAAELTLSNDDLADLNRISNDIAVHGARGTGSESYG